VTHNYGIHAINSDKTISLNIFYSIGNHVDRIILECQSVCGSEV